MGAYRLVVFESTAARDVAYEFEAETDRDAVRVGKAAAAGERGALWRDGRLLLKLERADVDQPVRGELAGVAEPRSWEHE